MECCLELLDRGLLVALQDLGAAGLTSSSGEMAAKEGVGIEIDALLREADLEPFEVMISESQERMLAVVDPARLDEVLEVCERWQTGAAAIGTVTDTSRVTVLRGGEVVGDVPVGILVDGCPLYDLEPAEPEGGCTATRQRSRPTTRDWCCCRCSPRPASPASGGRSSSTTRSSSRERCAGPSPRTRRC